MKKLSPPTTIPSKPHFIAANLSYTQLIPDYRRSLPHLYAEGMTYFITFRLSDSIPKSAILKWEMEYHYWLRLWGLDPNLSTIDPELFQKTYLEIPVTERMDFERKQHHKWFFELDKCHGCCVLEKHHEIVARGIEFFHGKRVWIGDYVVMPNHVHLIAQPFPGVKLHEWLYSVKRFTAREIGSCFEGNLKEVMHRDIFWQSESFDRIIRDKDELIKTRNYIKDNPVKLRTGTYSYSAMSWLDEFCER